MRQRAPCARQPLPVWLGPIALPVSLAQRPSPQPAPEARLVRALLWLYRLLFVRAVGRRAREERLGALPGRILHDIGLKRVDVQAATWGGVRLREVVRAYPSAGPLCVCGRPDFPLTLVRLSEAA